MASALGEIFVVGSPRSGTTLMAGALNQIPGVRVGRETGFIPLLYREGMESLHKWDDGALQRVIKEVNSYLAMEQWPESASVSGARRYWSDSGDVGYAGLIRYVWSLGDPAGQQVRFAGDQTPGYVLAMPLLEQLFPQARYVHVVRDPRDVVASILPLKFGAKSVGVAAADWNEYQGAWWAAERWVPPERRAEFRYEDLVRNPQQTIEALAGFLGLPAPAPDPGREVHIETRDLAAAVPHHARLTEPINDEHVGRYRQRLSDRDRSIVEALTYTGLVTYGYEVGPYRPSPVLTEDAALLTKWRIEDALRRAVQSIARRWPG